MGSGSYAVSITNNTTLTFDSTAAQEISGIISGTGKLEKTGSGILTLSNANTYEGGTTIDTSVSLSVVAANSSAFGTDAVVVNGRIYYGAALSVNTGLTINNALTLKPISDRAGLKLNGNAEWAGDITVDGSSNSSTISIYSGGTTSAPSLISGDISHTGAKANDLLLRGGKSGDITGSINYGTGTVQIGDSSTKWQFSNASNTCGTLNIENSGKTAYVGATNTLSATGKVIGTGDLKLNNLTGTTAYDQTIAGLDDGVNVSLDTGSATLTLDSSSDFSSSGVISSAISLVKTGTGTQTLNGANTYSGTTTVAAGTLALGAPGTISSTLTLGTSAGGSGILDVTAKSSFTQADLSGNGTVNIGAGKTINVSNTLGPGFSPGTLNVTGDLTILGTATTTMELANHLGTVGISSDFIDVTGTLTFGGTLNIVSFGVYNLNQTATYNLFDATTPIAGNFDFVNVGGTSLNKTLELWSGTSGTNTYAFNEIDGVLTVVSIPEPSSILLGAIGFLALLRRRR